MVEKGRIRTFLGRRRLDIRFFIGILLIGIAVSSALHWLGQRMPSEEEFIKMMKQRYKKHIIAQYQRIYGLEYEKMLYKDFIKTGKYKGYK